MAASFLWLAFLLSLNESKPSSCETTRTSISSYGLPSSPDEPPAPQSTAVLQATPTSARISPTPVLLGGSEQEVRRCVGPSITSGLPLLAVGTLGVSVLVFVLIAGSAELTVGIGTSLLSLPRLKMEERRRRRRARERELEERERDLVERQKMSEEALLARDLAITAEGDD